MPVSLTRGSDLLGLHLVGRKGAKLGSVCEIYVDLADGRIEFVMVEARTLLGGSGKFRPVPWASIHHDAVAGVFLADLTKDEFNAAPSYDREQLTSPGYGWDEQATRYFTVARTPVNAHMV